MALTVVQGDNGYTVVFDGATDFNQATNTEIQNPLPNGKNIKSIQFIPSALNDVLTVREEDAIGRIIIKVKAASEYDQRIKYFDGTKDRRHKLFVAAADASSGAMMIVET